MAIDRQLGNPIGEFREEDIEIVIEDPEAVTTETEDGGMLIDFTGGMEEPSQSFGANLADSIDENELSSLSKELVSQYHGDKDSRGEWEEAYRKGLDLLGLKIEERTEPWPGACGVHHPLLTEAVVRFQSQAISEIFPAAGPVKTQILGKITDEKEQQANRVKEHMNYLLTERMVEYRGETEKLLFSLPLAGSAFRKIYWDVGMGRPCAVFVPAEDMVVSYGATDLLTASRITQVMKRTSNEVRKLQVAGFYRDIELPTPGIDVDQIQRKYDELTGDRPDYDWDNRHTLLEMHVYMDMPGYEDVGEDGEETGIALPYVITIDLTSTKVLSVYRNWYEDDPNRTPRQHFVHYEYLPGLGFYGFGLIHLIGGITRSATSLLRQLVDAGTLSNLPGGLKARGLRIKGDDSPIMPGEFRDVDVPGGTIRDNITFLPYKEPSTVLAELLGNIVEEGRRFASIADVKAADMNTEAPVGTTLALLERNMKVMSAIQARLHAAMRREFRVLTNVVRDMGPVEYEYELVPGEEAAKGADFDERVDVIPVSNPNATTMAQRIMQYQAALQLSSTAPDLYNMAELHRQMLDVLGIENVDDIVPPQEEIPPLDPVTENMNLFNGQPVRAFPYQDQEAHIQVHMAAAQDPKIGEMLANSPNAQAIEGAIAAHVTEHLAFQYRREIEEELGVQLPPLGEPLPEDIELRLSKLVSEAAGRVLGKDQAEMQQREIQERMEDPVVQMQEKELQIREAEVYRKAEENATKVAADLAKAEERAKIDRERMATQERIAGARIGADVAKEQAKEAQEDRKVSANQRLEGARLGEKIAEIVFDNNDNKDEG